MTSNDELIASARAVATAIRTWLSVGRRDADRIDAIADRLAALGRDRDLTAAENRDLLDENMKLEARLAALTTPQEGTARTEMSKSSVVAYHEWRKAYGLDRLSDDEGTAARIAFYAGWDWARTTSPDTATEREIDLQRTIEDLREELSIARGARQAALDIMDAHRCGEKNESIMETLVEARAEHDAATAAIERVRALHRRDSVLSDYCGECSDFGSDQHPPGQLIEWPCSTVAALDGAPEPEWEYKYAEMLGGTEHTYGDENGKPFATWEAANLARIEDTDYVVGRRKAGPWVPVGSEDVQA